jgi:hypothetical protein
LQRSKAPLKTPDEVRNAAYAGKFDPPPPSGSKWYDPTRYGGGESAEEKDARRKQGMKAAKEYLHLTFSDEEIEAALTPGNGG